MASRRKPRVGSRARIIPNKGRRLQISPTRRKLFDEKAQDAFLEWFAATCNCSLSARKVGFHYRTVLRHWREDADFGARCEGALGIGYKRLEELALREAEAALSRPARPLAGPAAPLGAGETAALRMTPQDALQLLREHKRGMAAAASGAAQRKAGRAPSVASNAEVFDALVKRLKVFGIRVREEEARPSTHSTGSGEPSLRTGEPTDENLLGPAAACGEDEAPPPGNPGDDLEGPAK